MVGEKQYRNCDGAALARLHDGENADNELKIMEALLGSPQAPFHNIWKIPFDPDES